MTSSIDVVISPFATRNLENILNYTERQWGTGQRETYQRVLEAAFARIGTYPDIGKPAEDGPPNTRELILKHHTILYLREPDRVTILRIRGHRRRRS